jgi:phage shock protein C
MASSTRSLHRSTRNRMIAGVLGGLAEYFELDPSLLRAGYVVVSILSVGFPGILVYAVLWMVVPEDGSAA